MIMKKSVCAIIVTYNRAKCLDKTLVALFNQTYKIDKFIVINNNSSDGTVDVLHKNGIDASNDKVDEFILLKSGNREYYYYFSGSNLGGAGGFAIAIKKVKDLDVDLVWIMDDDIEPRKDCLEKSISLMDDNHRIIVPRRIGENFTDTIVKKYRFCNPFVYLFVNRCVIEKKVKKNTYDVMAFTFEGPLIDKKIIQQVGVPNEKYFLQGDDYDYSFRCLKYTRILYVVDAIIDRQLPFNPNLSNKNYWRLYYSLRNASLLDLRYSKPKFIGKLKVYNNMIRWFFIGIKHKNKNERKVVKIAFRDALNNKDGKVYNPGEI